jgi:hypothetical protein
MMSGASPSGAIGAGLAVVRRERAAGACAAVRFAAAGFAPADSADFAPAVFGAAGSAASCFVVADFARLEGRFAGASASAAPAEARGVRRTAPGPADAAFDGSPSAGLPPSDGGSAVLIRFLLKA